VHHTHNADGLAGALLDLVGILNSPRYDDILLREAGVAIDRALFPLLVCIGAAGSVSVVELAEQVGRDHSTVSRQTAKLETLGLVTRQKGQRDQRVREAALTTDGRRAVKAITAARRIVRRLRGSIANLRMQCERAESRWRAVGVVWRWVDQVGTDVIARLRLTRSCFGVTIDVP